ncbi:hypothetical protein AAF712_004503 [Marasmius tenuissimus]|uniref:Uncharacterized protein n=1 Tax=Marasmius tenuissimus TaxID=585030 RepID=A0ABR3A4E3_9AGAR
MINPEPYLHTIRLRNDYGDELFVIPDNFLGKCAPRLVHFEVQGCNVPWGSPILRNLTTLSVAQVSTVGSSTSLEEVAATLIEAAATLQVVEMSDFLPSHANLVLPRAMKIKLPRLKRLYLSSGDTAVVTLLQHLSFPTSTTIHLVIPQLHNSEASLVDYISSIFSDVSTTPKHPRTIRALLLNCLAGYDLVLSAWNVAISCPGGQVYQGDPTPHFRCHLGSRRRSGSRVSALPPSLFSQVLAGMGPLVNLETLGIGLADFPLDIMAQSFGRCALLRTIAIQGVCAFNVICSLSHSLPVASDSQMPAEPSKAKTESARSGPGTEKRKRTRSGTALVCPALKTLAISDVELDGLVSSLIDCLRFRRKSGFRVRKVDLAECRRVRSEDIDRIEDKGKATVVWDGCGSDASDEDDPYHGMNGPYVDEYNSDSYY